MKFKMSPNIAIPSTDVFKAAEFYTQVLGFSKKSMEPGMVEINADPITLFVTDDSQLHGPVMELFVDDLEAARDHLVAHGCEVIRWRGKGNDCYIKDPFGVTFNLWEVK
ncbi:MAG: VOC family protein [Candidatus Marinimicrobia bacterium]|nr:VOC family protein [Candidatus Neomarinimicrobiota bacterium]